MDLIHPDARIHLSAEIGPCVVIGPRVVIHEDVVISPFVSIGSQAEIRDQLRNPPGRCEIQAGTVIREHSTVNGGSDGRVTIIGRNVLLLNGTYVAHDCILEDYVTLCGHASLGGEVRVMIGANLGIGVMVHQFCTIGAYAMLGMGTIVTKKTKIEPGITYVGAPARPIGRNDKGLENVAESYLQLQRERYERLTTC